MMKQHEDENISRYIQHLDVGNVLTVDLNLDNNTYIDPSIEAYRRALEHQKGVTRHVKTVTIPKSFNSDSVKFDVEGVPQIPEGVDPRKICPFCQKTFSHPGSMGRHLDLKKGSKDHPSSVIEQMRSQVKRRGDAELIKERRKLRARRYNARDDVKQRKRLNRKSVERVQRAKYREIRKFFDRLGKPQLEDNPTFPRLVLYFLKPNQWPSEPPTLETYRQLCGSLNEQFLADKEMNFYNEVMGKVQKSSEIWLTMTDEEKLEVWARELRSVAQQALQDISLFDLRNRDVYVRKEAKRQVFEADNQENDNNNDSNDDSDDNDANNNESDGEDGKDSDKDFDYNHEELEAVAQAVVNDNEKDNVDPQIMN